MATVHVCDGCGNPSDQMGRVGYVRPELEYCEQCLDTAVAYTKAVDEAQEAAADLFDERMTDIRKRFLLREYPY